MFEKPVYGQPASAVAPPTEGPARLTRAELIDVAIDVLSIEIPKLKRLALENDEPLKAADILGYLKMLQDLKAAREEDVQDVSTLTAPELVILQQISSKVVGEVPLPFTDAEYRKAAKELAR